MPGKTYTTDRNSVPARVSAYDSQSPANSEVVASGPIAILDVTGLNTGGSTLYLMCFDSATMPNNGATPMFQPIALAAGAQVTREFNVISGDGLCGLATSAGLVWAASTTLATLTVSGTSSVWTFIQFYS